MDVTEEESIMIKLSGGYIGRLGYVRDGTVSPTWVINHLVGDKYEKAPFNDGMWSCEIYHPLSHVLVHQGEVSFNTHEYGFLIPDGIELFKWQTYCYGGYEVKAKPL